jgi:hypothetical protein
MMLLSTIIVVLLALTLLGGLYYRVAELDILASEKVWDRISSNVKLVIDNDVYPDDVVKDISIFSIMTGCGCFTTGALLGWVSQKFFVRKEPDGDLWGSISLLNDGDRHTLSAIMNDLMLFDSLHSPILGRCFRFLYRDVFRRADYRSAESGAVGAESVRHEEVQNIVFIASSVEKTLQGKESKVKEYNLPELCYG